MKTVTKIATTEMDRSVAAVLPISVVVPTRNEAHNLPRCLNALQRCSEVYVIDSQSTDDTIAIAQSAGATVVQFHYQGGWPKKRQWALNTLPFANDWILLLDADEILTPDLAEEIRAAIQDQRFDGYYIRLQLTFLGRPLHYGDSGLWKLSLFRYRKGNFECRLKEQDASMGDMEVHEHVFVAGRSGYLKSTLLHENVDSLSHYIRKHNEYSNWESRVLLNRSQEGQQLQPSLFGTQAQRRRWLKKVFYKLPGSPIMLFLYQYFVRLGFLDGVPGLIYCGFQAIQMFHTKAKIYELRCNTKSCAAQR